MRFSKFEGLGNDFLIARAQAMPPEIPSARVARAICQRTLGVGADGLLIMGAPRSPAARLRMEVWNADSSEA